MRITGFPEGISLLNVARLSSPGTDLPTSPTTVRTHYVAVTLKIREACPEATVVFLKAKNVDGGTSSFKGKKSPLSLPHFTFSSSSLQREERKRGSV